MYKNSLHSISARSDCPKKFFLLKIKLRKFYIQYMEKARYLISVELLLFCNKILFHL